MREENKTEGGRKREREREREEGREGERKRGREKADYLDNFIL